MRGRGMVLAAVVLMLSAPGSAHAQSRKAFNTLRLLKQVDGAGSGLDADTVRGVTPDQIANSVLAIIASTVITNYVALNQVTIDVGFCSCVHVPCTSSQDAVISCGGGFVPFNAAAHLTEISPVTNPTQCEVCGCNDGGVSVPLIGVASCLKGVRVQ